MNKRMGMFLVLLLILFLIIIALFSCHKQKPQTVIVGSASQESSLVQDAIVTEPVVLEPMNPPEKKKVRWIEEKKVSGNRGYIVHDGIYVYFGHVTIQRKEIVE